MNGKRRLVPHFCLLPYALLLNSIQDLDRRHKLSRVARGVLGAMKEAAAYSRRQPGAADSPFVHERRRVGGA